MIAYSDSLIYNPANDTEYRTIISFISQALDSFGLTKTADTGQVDPATVLRSATLWNLNGYEVRQFTDALQATAPVVFRIDYLTGDVANRLGLRLTVGTGSDGAGNITGYQSAALTQFTTDSGASTKPVHSYMSGESNRLQMALYADNTASQGFYSTMWMGLERAKDTTGADTGDGVWAMTGRGYQTLQHCYIPFNVLGVPPIESSLNAAASTNWTNCFNGKWGAAPVYPWCGARQNPIKGFMVAGTNDLETGKVITLAPYGTPIRYIMPNNVTDQYGIDASNRGTRFLMRWE